MIHSMLHRSRWIARHLHEESLRQNRSETDLCGVRVGRGRVHSHHFPCHQLRGADRDLGVVLHHLRTEARRGAPDPLVKPLGIERPYAELRERLMCFGPAARQSALEQSACRSGRLSVDGRELADFCAVTAALAGSQAGRQRRQAGRRGTKRTVFQAWKCTCSVSTSVPSWSNTTAATIAVRRRVPLCRGV